MLVLFFAGVAIGLIHFAIKYEASTTRTCERCGLTVTGPKVHPRCPSCGTPLDVKAA